MTYEILGESVWRTELVATKAQVATIKTEECYLRRILISAETTNLKASQVAIITLKWQIFDLESEAYTDELNTAPITVDVSGTTDILQPDTSGVAQFEFASPATGAFVIRTMVSNVDNSELVVTVT